MLFGAMEPWEVLATILGAGGVGALGQWLIAYLSKRKEWANEDEVRTVNAWKDYAKKRDEDVTELHKEVNTLRADYTERMRKAEERIDRETKRRYKCERRWELSEAKIEDLQYAIDRFNDHQDKSGKPERLLYRKHSRPLPDEDDSWLDENNNKPVRPHGPDKPNLPGGNVK